MQVSAASRWNKAEKAKELSCGVIDAVAIPTSGQATPGMSARLRVWGGRLSQYHPVWSWQECQRRLGSGTVPSRFRLSIRLCCRRGPMGSRFSPRSVVEQRLDNGLGPALLIREDLLDGLHQALAAPT